MKEVIYLILNRKLSIIKSVQYGKQNATFELELSKIIFQLSQSDTSEDFAFDLKFLNYHCQNFSKLKFVT